MKFEKIVIHAGVFHADDALCVAMAQMLWPDIKIERVFKVPENIGANVLVADIGGGKFDHHQADAPVRGDGFPHCAASLMWKAFGSAVVKNIGTTLSSKQVNRVVMQVDAELFRSVSAIDNGCNKSKSANGVLGAADVFSLNSMVAQFNPAWNSAHDAEACFLEAVRFVRDILTRMIERKVSVAEGENMVAKACEEAAENGTPEIIVLPTYIPWQSYICRNIPKALVVVFPTLRGGYNVQLVPIAANSFETRTKMPTEWYGKSEGEAEKLMDGMTFCHKSGFLAAFTGKEAAMNAAKYIAANNSIR